MTGFSTRLQSAGLLTGPLAGLLLYLLLPEFYVDAAGETVTLSQGARSIAAVGAWMAIWWMTEAISIYATALLPLALFPLTGAISIRETAASYGHEVIYLFLGGFVLALALERCGLHRRVALAVLKRVGTHPGRIVGGFMFVAAFTSMWVTNTATTIMLLPVATSVIALAEAGRSDAGAGAAGRDHFSLCLLLGIAYAATAGGIGTIIGTAPNAFVVSFVASEMNREISFLTWMMFGVPVALVIVPLIWWLLTRIIYPVGTRPLDRVSENLRRLADELGPLDRAEKLTLVIFLLTAGAWITRPLLNRLEIAGTMPFAGLSDAGVAVLSALALFVTPVNFSRREFLMNWETAVRLPWGLLILFGGGLSLAAGLNESGFSDFLGTRALFLEPFPSLLIVATVTAIMIFLTELTSNTATTATLIPILFAIATALSLDPFLLILPAGIAASCAFMLPVATPPNAIVFGTGRVTIAAMTRAGFWLNLAGILLITAMSYLVIIPIVRMTG